MLLRPDKLIDMESITPLLAEGTARHIFRELDQVLQKSGVAQDDAGERRRLLDAWRAAVSLGEPAPADDDGVVMF